MRKALVLLGIAVVLALVASACGGGDDSPAMSGDVQSEDADDAGAGAADAKDTTVSFGAPASGASVARRFPVAMEAKGIEIEPAGAVREGAGHFHVMIDAGCVAPGEAITKDAQHVHFGKGQLEGQLFLEPGEHALCLQVADGAHVALPVTDEITVTVDADEPYVSLGVPEGDTVTSPVPVTMEPHGVTVEPAGEVHNGAGHFHVMVDTGCVEPGQAIAKDATHLHFGDASTETALDLAAGEHTLCLQLGDGAHVALPLTHTVTVTVA